MDLSKGGERRPRKNVYLAAPLFSAAERSFNVLLRSRLERHVSVFLPQEDGLLLAKMLSDGVHHTQAYKMVFERDVSAIERCDGIVAVLDGRTVDEGVAFELGLAFGLGKTRVGLQTDPRRLLGVGNNPMIDCALDAVFHEFEALDVWIARWCAAPGVSSDSI